MPRFYTQQLAFTSGELDPLLHARSDVAKYGQAAAVMENWMIRAAGVIERRPGTVWLAELGETGVLADFIFSSDQRFIIALIDAGAVVYDPDGAVIETLAGARWTAAILRELDWIVIGSTMIVVHPTMQPHTITRTGTDSFALGDYSFDSADDGNPVLQPYYKFADKAVTLDPTATTGTVTLVTSADYWDAGHVGLIVRYAGKEIEITAVTNATTATGNVKETLAAATATKDWDEQAFSDLRGWPGAVEYHQQRVIFSKHPLLPSRIWMSQVGLPAAFSVGTGLDAEAITIDIAGAQVPRVQKMLSSRHLQIFCSTGEYYIPSAVGQPLTPATVTVERQTPFGSSETVKPVELDGATLFIQRNGKTVREFLYTDDEQAYSAEAVSFLSSHLIDEPIDMTVLRGNEVRPEQYVFVVNTDGSIAVFHSIRSEGVAGWSPWVLAHGKVISMRALDIDIYMIVEWTEGGRFTLERLGHSQGETCLDCTIADTSGGGPTDTFAFPELEGLEVQLVAPITVDLGGGETERRDFALGLETLAETTGEVVLEDGLAYETLYAGFFRPSTLETLRIAGQQRDGPIQGRIKRVVAVLLDLYETRSVATAGQILLVRQVTDDMSIPPQSVSGYQRFILLGHDREGRFEITVEDPLPCTIRAMLMEVST